MMNIAAMLAFASAIFCGVVALTVIWNERRSVVHTVFVVGMGLLALESIFSGLSWEAGAASWDKVVYWHRCKLYTDSVLPGVWLFFALSYGRGNYREFLSRWKFLLLAAFVVPVGLVAADRHEVFANESQPPLVAGLTGFYLILMVVAGLLLTGINLEKTYRTSVGVMRWRIKFMVLGLGVLFAIRFCTFSQILLTHTFNPTLEMVDVGALFVACVLMLRSLFRAGHFDLDIYPSHTVLQGSLTFMLAGIYLFGIGMLAKVVSLFQFREGALIQWFVVVIASVLLAILLLSDRVRLRINRFVSQYISSVRCMTIARCGGGSRKPRPRV